MRQIEQDQIDVAAAFEQVGHLLERAGLGDLGAVEQAGHRLAQRAAEQRMIVGDHQAMELQLRSMRCLSADLYCTIRPGACSRGLAASH